MRHLVLATLIFTAISSHSQSSYETLAGRWRGEFILQDTVAVPFVFEVDHGGHVSFLNGTERFESGTLQLKGDSLFIPLDQFDNELAFKVKGKMLSGVFRRQDHTGIPLLAKAVKGNHPRFASGRKPAGDMSGKYEVTSEDESTKTVGIFKQEGNRLTGTFLRTSGDTRFLEGIVAGNKFYLSAFYGSSPTYFEGSFTADGKVVGHQFGTRTRQPFSAIKNDSATMADAYSLTGMKPGYTTLDFSFPDIDGRKISLKDDKYRGKVVIVAVTGTWCPNCVDEAAFLSPWYDSSKHRGVEVIALHYERKSDTGFTRKVMRRFRDRFDIKYDQVFAGVSNNDSVAASLPALSRFIAFPTTIFIDKKGNVSKIHTGYSGPATGRFYDAFLKEFNEEVDKLLNQ